MADDDGKLVECPNCEHKFEPPTPEFSRMVVKIARADGRIDEITVPPATQVHYEKHFRPLAKIGEGPSPMNNIYEFAFEVEKHIKMGKGEAVSSYTDWLNDIQAVTTKEEPILPFKEASPV